MSPAMNWAGPRALLLCLAPAATFAGGDPLGHPGPPIWMEIDVEEHRLRLSVHAEPVPLAEHLGIEDDLVGPFLPERERVLAETIQEGFRGHPRVSVNGDPVTPQIERVVFPEDLPDSDPGWLVVEVQMSLPLQGLPRQIGVQWERFRGTAWAGEQFVPITFRHGRLPEIFSLWPEEPACTWHAPRLTMADAPPLAPMAPVRLPLLRVPLGSAVALAAGALSLSLLRRRRTAILWSATIVALGVAWGLRSRWVLPLGQRGLERPSEEEALAVFDQLHAGVYRAFEEKTEAGIYERLSASVAPALVAPLYGDVYQSLVLRAEGGALCAIESVDVQERRVRFPDEGEGFEVEAVWQVHGIVSHWGHVHRRSNSYRARHRIGAFAETSGGASDDSVVRWRIAAVDVLEHHRSDQ